MKRWGILWMAQKLLASSEEGFGSIELLHTKLFITVDGRIS
jgi:hypothetical protein